MPFRSRRGHHGAAEQEQPAGQHGRRVAEAVERDRGRGPGPGPGPGDQEKRQAQVRTAGRNSPLRRTGPDLHDEVALWQADDFWQCAMYATAACIRAIALDTRVIISMFFSKKLSEDHPCVWRYTAEGR
jgi:hypothetical protein